MLLLLYLLLLGPPVLPDLCVSLSCFQLTFLSTNQQPHCSSHYSDNQEDSWARLPTIRPNSSRVIITWPHASQATPTTELQVASLEVTNQTTTTIKPVVPTNQADLGASSSSPSVQLVALNSTTNATPNVTPNATTFAPTDNLVLTSSTVQTSQVVNVSSTTTRLPARTTTSKTKHNRTTVKPRLTSSTRRPTTADNNNNNESSLAASEDPIEWAEHMHTTPRPYDSKRDCGMRPMKGFGRREGRVVGGRDSHLGEFPWSVLIRETTLLGFFIKTKCGGVLIDLKWVLTAAHCQPGMFGSLIVVVGEYDLSGRSERLKPLIKKVKRMIIHRDYNPSNFDNDIALLELESPFQVQPHVVPICLPDKDDEFIGQPAMVAGWGKLSFGGPVPSVLQVAKLPVIGNKQCQQMYHNSGHMKIISDSFLCAGYANGGQDSCEGDSGGPLQVQRANDSRWVLVGTVSHGIKCAEPNLPGIYIRTGAYLPWIKAVTFHQDHNKRYGH